MIPNIILFCGSEDTNLLGKIINFSKGIRRLTHLCWKYSEGHSPLISYSLFLSVRKIAKKFPIVSEKGS